MKNRLGVCTWSLNNDVEKVRRVLDENGLRHLHLAVSASDAYRDVIASQGWTVSCTMISFPQEDYSTLESIRATGGIVPDAHWEQNRRLALNAIEVTAGLGVPFLSMHAGFIDHGDAGGYAAFCGRLRELSDAAASRGLRLLLETGQETAGELRSCLEHLNHPALGINFDPANMILYGKGDPVEAVHLLAPWIRHVHIKDAVRSSMPGAWGTEVPWGDGQVDAGGLIRALESEDYSGVLAIERETGESRMADIRLAVERLGGME